MKVTDNLRDDLAHFGKKIDYTAIHQWNDSTLRPSRLGLLNRYIEDVSKSDPTTFAEILDPVLDDIKPNSNSNKSRQFLDTYCQNFPGSLLQDGANLPPEKVATFLPIARKLSRVSVNLYWNRRDACFNGNVVLHVLANRMEEYKEWLKSLDDNTRINLENYVDLTQTIALLKNTLSDKDTPEERRFEILNGLFSATSVGRNSSSSSASQVFSFMVEQEVITKDEILKHGPKWAEENPRDGAAYGELAKFQAEAERNEDAVLNYLQAVVHVPINNQRLYTQFLLEKARLLLDLGRTEAAVNWFEFAQSGRIHSNSQDEFDALERTARVRYLTDPARSESTLSGIRDAINTNPADEEPWQLLAEVLSAHGKRAIDRNEAALGTSLLKLSYFIQVQMQDADSGDPSAEPAAYRATKQDLARGLATIGQGGQKHVLVKKNSEWFYFYQAGGYGGTSWRRSESIPSNWQSGAAPLGYGDGDETTTLDFGSDSENKHIAAYFKTTFDIESSSDYDQLSLAVLHDDGFVAYLNGNEIARNNLGSGAINPTTLAPKSRSSDEENEFWQTTVPADSLQPGTNVLAVEVHQNKPDSSDLGFDLELASEALNTTAIIEEVGSGTVMQLIGDWKEKLPANLVARAKALERTDDSPADLATPLQ